MTLTAYVTADPGRGGGWGRFAPFGYLAQCGLSREPYTDIPREPLLVIEKPHGGKGKASRTDLVKLSRRMQMVIDHVRAARVIELLPRRWKGTIDKSIMTRRILNDWMTDGERAILAASRWPKNHNVIDAIGIGIWYAAVLGLREIH